MDSARATAQRHQDVVASVTADNLLFLLRAKSAEARGDAATAEADQLRAAAVEGRDPWLGRVHFTSEASTLALQRAVTV